MKLAAPVTACPSGRKSASIEGVVAYSSLEDGEFYDKQILAKYETQGQPVRVQKSSKTSLDVKIIPAPQQ